MGSCGTSVMTPFVLTLSGSCQPPSSGLGPRRLAAEGLPPSSTFRGSEVGRLPPSSTLRGPEVEEPAIFNLLGPKVSKIPRLQLSGSEGGRTATSFSISHATRKKRNTRYCITNLRVFFKEHALRETLLFGLGCHPRKTSCAESQSILQTRSGCDSAVCRGRVRRIFAPTRPGRRRRPILSPGPKPRSISPPFLKRKRGSWHHFSRFNRFSSSWNDTFYHPATFINFARPVLGRYAAQSRQELLPGGPAVAGPASLGAGPPPPPMALFGLQTGSGQTFSFEFKGATHARHFAMFLNCKHCNMTIWSTITMEIYFMGNCGTSVMTPSALTPSGTRQGAVATRRGLPADAGGGVRAAGGAAGG